MITLAIAIFCTAAISCWSMWAGIARGDHLSYVAADGISLLVQVVVASMLLSWGLAIGPITIL